jgi:hypothetical protein
MMMEHIRVAVTPRDRFLQAAQNEKTNLERREIESGKKDRQTGSSVLQMPVSKRAAVGYRGLSFRPYAHAIVFVGTVSLVFVSLVALERVLGG